MQWNAVVLMRVELIRNPQAHIPDDAVTESSVTHSSLWWLEENGFPKLLHSSQSPKCLSVGADQGLWVIRVSELTAPEIERKAKLSGNR